MLFQENKSSKQLILNFYENQFMPPRATIITSHIYFYLFMYKFTFPLIITCERMI